MEDLLTWLRQQLDDDEQAARAVEGPYKPYYFDFIDDDARPFVDLALDPARALAEVDAKRRILDEHARGQSGFIWVTSAEVTDRADVVEERTNAEGVKVARVPLWICTRCSDWYPDAQRDEDSHVSHGFPCLTVRLIALPYADRPGYREEWRA
ncbi:DUF6221 family protein [Micromonospora okii]|uniref:DUF6221 family protein n=1 Tax=Micromonospora okii TaxID=1182970 RepID=UPI001E329202|nr:DUF6221 family protein [Micromonospora okii]